ncbi:30S ribosome-binding factor RbfA [bacterium]|nr:30S ribosome-binding factor RbfA [bacterium]
MAKKRIKQLEHILLDKISRILSEDMSDPRLGLISLTGVELSPDAKFAKIYYSVLGSDRDLKSTEIVLTRAVKYIQLKLANIAGLRYTPHIVFMHDESVEHGFKIEEMLREIGDTERDDSEDSGDNREE